MSHVCPPSFLSLGLSDHVLAALADAGYKSPSPIQAASIPHLLAGRDLLGQAQTGTGKTAAFALPLLSKPGAARRGAPGALVLTPTRELAIQVAEAFQGYARHIPDFHVVPIYGGQSHAGQLRQLRRGAQVVVGTPGRVMDHMRRGTLKTDNLRSLVLDEADEMLRMGFIADVEWILERLPARRQIALFSATMPAVIRRVAQRHLRNPAEVKIAARTRTAATIRQRYCMVSGPRKLEALTRILEGEAFDAMLVFVRTRAATVDLAEKLAARGHACAPLNGDIPQALREKTVARLRNGGLDVLVATDVAARGLDVARVSHVVNYDIPPDSESYVHRIGRTGRAGRSGEAILFVSARERRLLRAIEQATRQPIEVMEMPGTGTINRRRIARFKQRIADTLAREDLDPFRRLVEEFQAEQNVEPLQLAAALAAMAQGDAPLLLAEDQASGEESAKRQGRVVSGTSENAGKTIPSGDRRDRRPQGSGRPLPLKAHPGIEMERFRLAVGRSHGVRAGNIGGAIANEAGIESEYIGRIAIHEDHCTVDLPAGMPREIFRHLKQTRVCGRPLALTRMADRHL
ncbi:MAG TPA: DEAD/DEAH box helicase [Gammaproteobacteria bacterium]|nr:DEAD/DEAH box helicase [Gammaproteobacteria bacterium]